MMTKTRALGTSIDCTSITPRTKVSRVVKIPYPHNTAQSPIPSRLLKIPTYFLAFTPRRCTIMLIETCLSTDNTQAVPRKVIHSKEYSLNCTIQKGLGILNRRVKIEYPMENVMNKRSKADMTANMLQILSRSFATGFFPLCIIPKIPIICRGGGAAVRMSRRLIAFCWQCQTCRKDPLKYSPVLLKKGKAPRSPLRGAGLQLSLQLFF